MLTDPRGRRIGFDPVTKHAWQELPEAKGFIEFDLFDGKQEVAGVVQVCGHLSGASRLEIIARETSRYTISMLRSE